MSLPINFQVPRLSGLRKTVCLRNEKQISHPKYRTSNNETLNQRHITSLDYKLTDSTHCIMRFHVATTRAIVCWVFEIKHIKQIHGSDNESWLFKLDKWKLKHYSRTYPGFFFFWGGGSKNIKNASEKCYINFVTFLRFGQTFQGVQAPYPHLNVLLAVYSSLLEMHFRLQMLCSFWWLSRIYDSSPSPPRL